MHELAKRFGFFACFRQQQAKHRHEDSVQDQGRQKAAQEPFCHDRHETCKHTEGTEGAQRHRQELDNLHAECEQLRQELRQRAALLAELSMFTRLEDASPTPLGTCGAKDQHGPAHKGQQLPHLNCTREEQALVDNIHKLKRELEQVTEERDVAQRQLALLQDSSTRALPSLCHDVNVAPDTLSHPHPGSSQGGPTHPHLARVVDVVHGSTTPCTLPGQQPPHPQATCATPCCSPPDTELCARSLAAPDLPDVVQLCALPGTSATPEGLRVITAESCAAACKEHPKMAIQMDAIYPYEHESQSSMPSCKEVMDMARTVWMSPGLLELFEMPRDLARALALRNKVVVRPSAIRAVLKGIWRAFFVERDFRPSVIRGVVYHAVVPTHFVCTHTTACIWQDDDGRRFWASLALFDCSSADYIDRVTRGILMEHQALKYTPSSVIMTTAQGRIVYQNAASVEALGMHASHMRVRDSDILPQEANMNYFTELFYEDQALVDDMFRVTAAAEVFRTRVRIQSSLLLSWLNPLEVEVWHDVQVTRARDAVNKEPVYIVAQVDVTEAVVMERRVKELQEQQQSLLASILPEQVIEVLLQGTSQDSVPDECPSRGPSVLAREFFTSEKSFLRATSMPSSPQDCRSKPSASGPGQGGLNDSKEALKTRFQSARHRTGPCAPEPAMSPSSRLSELSTYHDEVTILFTDIQGFTQLSRFCHPSAVMVFLNELFSEFDKIVDAQGPLGVYKVETIGDCYMVCAGLFRLDAAGRRRVGGHDPQHAHKVLSFARAMLTAAADIKTPIGEPVKMRIGMHSGPCMSGVVGRKMPRFCLFGDTVNTASRMESTGLAGRIHVSHATRELLPDETWEPTGGIFAKGKGIMTTYLLSQQG